MCINFDWTGHLAFVRKHTEIKDIDEGYEVEISPESQEVRQNNFFLNLKNYLRRTAVLIFVTKDLWTYSRDVFYFLISDNWYNNIGGCDRRANSRGDNR